MSEFEFLYLVNNSTASMNQVLAVMFTLIFAYFAGLYIFIRKAPLFIRIVIYVLFSATLYFTWTGGMFIFSSSMRALEARRRLVEQGDLPPNYTMETQELFETMTVTNIWQFNALTIAVLLVYFYLTFFYKWSRHDD